MGLALLLAGCGGKATIDGRSDAGGAGGSATSVTTNQASSQSGSVASSSTGMPDTLCGAACAAITACLSIDDCVPRCERVAPACSEQHDAWLSCVAQAVNPATCDLPPRCEALLGEWLACEGERVGPMGCTLDVDGCDCSSTVGRTVYDVTCLHGDPCTCQISDGSTKVVLGNCQDALPLTCAPDYSCCSTLFWVAGSLP